MPRLLWVLWLRLIVAILIFCFALWLGQPMTVAAWGAIRARDWTAIDRYQGNWPREMAAIFTMMLAFHVLPHTKQRKAELLAEAERNS